MIKKSSSSDKKIVSPAPKNIFHSRKFWMFGILSIAAYALLFSTLFLDFATLQSMIFVLLFFLFFHFFYLEIRRFPIKYLIILMLGVSLIEGFFIWYPHLFLVISALCINAGIIMLASSLQDESHNKISFSSLWYFNVGGYIFTVFITIGYSLFVFWYYVKFPFTCQDLSDTSSNVISFFTQPVAAGVEKIKTDTAALFNTKIKDIAVIGKDISLQTQQSRYATIIQNINAFKKNLIDQTLKDNTTVNMGICDYLLGQMNQIYENPAFKTSVILLMFLLLYGFVRIVFWLMTGIAFLIFKILLWLKVYRVNKVMKEVEDLE
ncbi:MAG: hypothetical protein ACD_80C00097G0003 [uncultured bacterium (gcode 4)]|uniref:Uncharacterized protein n=1 Tax=uncultured bacterium (gcode 4) TaxID=1234023 RepID=K1XJ93_9BACT|nr:MAG: hypothetical protein ACD_80C00097G0003 [uncultured bacterium (gcode 4)]